MTRIQECKKLREELENAEKYICKAERDIRVINESGSRNPKKQACIMLDDYYIGETLGNDWTVGERFESFVRKECPNFHCCSDINCPYFPGHKAYSVACNDRDAIEEKIHNFPLWVRFASLFVRTK